MGRSKQRFIDGVHTKSSIVAGSVIFQLILAVLNLNMILGPVQAGTEDGSFCCTCPDYANFDAWLAKKAQICDNAGLRLPFDWVSIQFRFLAPGRWPLAYSSGVRTSIITMPSIFEPAEKMS